MKDFAVRIWDSEEKKMIYIEDLYFFKENGIHTLGSFDKQGNNNRFKEPIMLASPHWDKRNKVRLYENDIVEIYYGIEKEVHNIGYIEQTKHKGWSIDCGSMNTYEMYNYLDKWYYVKIGDIYSNPDIIPNYRKAIADKKEAEKREKELQCLLKLKAKYEGKAGECEAVE